MHSNPAASQNQRIVKVWKRLLRSTLWSWGKWKCSGYFRNAGAEHYPWVGASWAAWPYFSEDIANKQLQANKVSNGTNGSEHRHDGAARLGHGKSKNISFLQNETKVGSLLSDGAGKGYRTSVSCLWGELTVSMASKKSTQVAAANEAEQFEVNRKVGKILRPVPRNTTASSKQL